MWSRVGKLLPFCLPDIGSCACHGFVLSQQPYRGIPGTSPLPNQVTGAKRLRDFRGLHCDTEELVGVSEEGSQKGGGTQKPPTPPPLCQAPPTQFRVW